MTHLKLSERIEQAIVDPSKCQVPPESLQAELLLLHVLCTFASMHAVHCAMSPAGETQTRQGGHSISASGPERWPIRHKGGQQVTHALCECPARPLLCRAWALGASSRKSRPVRQLPECRSPPPATSSGCGTTSSWAASGRATAPTAPTCRARCWWTPASSRRPSTSGRCPCSSTSSIYFLCEDGR